MPNDPLVVNTRRLEVRRMSDGEIVRTFGYVSAHSIAYSPDGAMLAAGDSEGLIRLWRVSDGALLRKLVGHSTEVHDLDFSPDGAILASTSTDGTVRLWRVGN